MSQPCDHIDSSLDSLRHLRSKLNLDIDEESYLSGELDSLEEMIDKLENGIVEIAVFGEVSSGKSSLLNALLGVKAFDTGARNGVTLIKEKREWNVNRKEFQGYGDSRLVLTDTPGINEVDGEARAAIAQDTIQDADIVLFVVKSDINEVEYRAIKELHKLNKPILVAFNKVDIYSQDQRQTIVESINEKLTSIVAPENILFTAGDPIEREVFIEKSNGASEQVMRKPGPIIDDLQERILDVLARDSKAIVALNASLFAANISDRIARRTIEMRRDYANKIVKKFILVKAIAVAINPVPLLDMAGGVAIDYYMLREISAIYNIEMSFKGSQDLMIEIAKTMGLLGFTEIVTNIVAGVLELTTLGLANLVTGVPQGLVAGWSSYIIGQASHEYFANGASWGERGAKSVIQEIIKTTDKSSVIAEIKKGVLEAISRNKKVRVGANV